jgi:hypothetical protein
MARRKNSNPSDQTLVFQIPVGSDLPSRIRNILKQTGLDTADLFQKWVLQEESLIGLLRHGKVQEAEGTKTFPVSQREVPEVREREVQEEKEAAEIGPNDPKYRKMLLRRAKKLKKEGATFVKIAKIFNDENLSTVSGKGKWYPSSIINLLNSNV